MQWLQKVPEVCRDLEAAVVALLLLTLVGIGAAYVVRVMLESHGLWPK